MIINGIEIRPDMLISRQDLLDFLKNNGDSDRALGLIRDRYQEEFGNELVWRYPISDGMHLGTFIVTIQEGFISLPYDVVDEEEYELLKLEDACMFDAEALQYFIDDWKSFSDDLLSAMSDMLKIVHSEKDERYVATQYYDDDGGLVFVSRNKRNEECWMTVRQKKPTSGKNRIKSKSLPLRSTREKAQADLDIYAQTKGWDMAE